ncbi:MAG: hypothetical protein SGJ27_14560 [Candidatus Melainabacteria bacterium]|nr:hypothetical protein [Candidatus Melainabacteria bacterium]
MNLKILTTLSLALVAASVTIDVQPAHAWKHGVNQRQNRQENRIQNGRQGGSLNRREAHRLNRQQNALETKEARFRASGNGLNASERARLQLHQNQLSQNIYQQKHDPQTRFNSPNHNPGKQLFDVNQTQNNQDKRIYNGIQSGELTRREATRLDNQQDRFEVKEAQMRQNGLTLNERRKLDAHQDQMNRNIYNQKHDAQDR